MSRSASLMACSASRARRRWKKSERTGFLLSERHYGAFQREIQLPADIDPNGIKAKFKGGVLTGTLNKDEKAPARTRKIAIE
jgi:HSP20 family protein